MIETANVLCEMKDVLISIKCVESCTGCMFEVKNEVTCKHTTLLNCIAALKKNIGCDINEERN